MVLTLYFAMPSERLIRPVKKTKSVEIFEDGALVASHAPLEGRGEKRLDPAHRQILCLPRRRTSEAGPSIIRRAGDRVSRRSLDFYEAVGQRLAAQGGSL
ncbi:MAG: hypothetical protein NVSMB58_37130 [Terriglobales bacterium]